MMNLLCRLGIHSFESVNDPGIGMLTDGQYIRGKGWRCRRCRWIRLRWETRI